MKKTLLTIATAFLAATTVSSQTWAFAQLDINSVRTGINSNGDMFWNYVNGMYEVPKDSSAGTIFAGAFWIGGLDVSSQLHLAAQTYRQTGSDFYPGPVMNSASYSAANDLLWNKVWKINKTTIDSFRLGLFTTVPAVIASWPGNGDVQQGQAAQLAPYVDVNNDGIYDPNVGDYPCVKGDQTLFVIFNDDRNTHGETGGQPLKVELHAMLYAYKDPGTWLDSTVFLSYKLYNRSTQTYTNTYTGSWTDLDIGAYNDDYVGCDVNRNCYYGYNGDVNDGTSAAPTTGTYGANPPAQGIAFLLGAPADPNDGVDNNHDGTIDEPGEQCGMSGFRYYDNNFTVTGNPVTAADYYNYLTGYWIDGSPVTFGGNGYGGNTPTNYMYPGDTDPNNPTLWSEVSENNMPSDRRGLGASGPFTMQPGQEFCLGYAYVFGRGHAGPASSVNQMLLNVDKAKTFLGDHSPCTCNDSTVSVHENIQPVVSVHPNPAQNNIHVYWNSGSNHAQIEIFDLTGKLMLSAAMNGASATVDLSQLSAGVYMLRITDGNTSSTAKIVRE